MDAFVCINVITATVPNRILYILSRFFQYIILRIVISKISNADDTYFKILLTFGLYAKYNVIRFLITPAPQNIIAETFPKKHNPIN